MAYLPPSQPGSEESARHESNGSDGADGNTTVHLPERVCNQLGVTTRDVEGYATMSNYNVQLAFVIALWSMHDCGFSSMLQYSVEIVNRGEAGKAIILGAVAKFFVINQFRPTLKDLVLVGGIVQHTVFGLALNDNQLLDTRNRLGNDIPNVGDSGVLPLAFRERLV